MCGMAALQASDVAARRRFNHIDTLTLRPAHISRGTILFADFCLLLAKDDGCVEIVGNRVIDAPLEMDPTASPKATPARGRAGVELQSLEGDREAKAEDEYQTLRK